MKAVKGLLWRACALDRTHSRAIQVALARAYEIGTAERRLEEVIKLLREGLASAQPLPDLGVLSGKVEAALAVAEGRWPLLGSAYKRRGP